LTDVIRTAAPARAEPRAGQIIGERYQLEELLQSGAMGSVWRAQQLSLRAPVAIKFLEPSLIENPEMNRRFTQEARSAAAVRSVHVVQIFDYGSDGDVPFIAMEYLEGEDLYSRLLRKGTLSPAELGKIFSEVAWGIGQAHALGVIHRDLKPANIFLAREGDHEVTKVIDFGIAKVMVEAIELSSNVRTRLGTLLGTPQYMSPEQVRGSRLLDHRTDLWALAIIACECLTGKYPFSGTTLGDLSVQICTEKPHAPSSLGPVPAGFDRWFFKGTNKQASGRFESVQEMADALAKILRSAGNGRAWLAWSKQLAATRQHIHGRVSVLSTFATVFRTRTIALLAVPLRRTRPSFSRNGLLALALVMGGLVLFLLRPGAPRRNVPAEDPTRSIQAASPAPLPRALEAAAAPVAAEPPSTSAAVGDVGVLLVAPAADAGPPPAPVRAAPRQRKRPLPEKKAETPLGPMSRAMGKAGESILVGDGMRREARERAAATAEARARATTTAPAPSPSAPPPAPGKPARPAPPAN
jgi:eukaryotic-like serine/threonine-protein kinase